VASFFGFLAVESVEAIEWVTNVAARLLRHPGAVAGGSARRAAHFFNMRPLLPEAFLSCRYLWVCRRRLNYKIERIDVAVANLPPELDGLRIAQLSDIHIATTCRAEIARAVDMANALSPDISFVTETLFRARAIRWRFALAS